MPLITEFDPWRSGLCTCPPKLTFNPYTGCDHACAYCYASSYIPQFTQCRPKKDVLTRLKREASKLKGQIVSIANSSDPYPNAESELGLTRQCLQTLAHANCKIQIITKSNLVTRDADILRTASSMVSITVTTDDDNLAKLLEPAAPPPSKRLQALHALATEGIPTSARIDPIIPYINDHTENLVTKLAQTNIKHVTCSTYKAKPDNWKRLSKTFPEAAEKLKPLYFEKGEMVSGYRYLPKDMRTAILSNVRTQVETCGMRFGTCREDLANLNTATCDGSWLFAEETKHLSNQNHQTRLSDRRNG